jgi:hypothetical protein
MKEYKTKLTNKQKNLLLTFCTEFIRNLDEDSSEEEFELELIFEKIIKGLKE